jgi:hypothetical protein
MRNRNVSILRITVASLIFLAAVVFSVREVPSFTAVVPSATGMNAPAGEFHPTFGMEGELMHQLLVAFGSERVADGMENLVLNCEPRLLVEEIRGDTAIVDVSLDCECLDREGDFSDITRLRSEWKLRLATVD